MQILQVILGIVAAISYGAVGFIAGYAFIRLRRMERLLMQIHHETKATLATALGEHLRTSFREINEMRSRLYQAVESDDYEEADRLKGIIEAAEKAAMHELENFRNTFGEDCVDIKLVQVKKT